MINLLLTVPLSCQLLSPERCSYGPVTIGTSPHNYATVLPEGYTAFPEVGKAYKFHANSLSWNAARKRCISEGANLAIIDTFQKVEYVVGLKEKFIGVWTGGHRLFDATEWTDIKTGQPLGFIPWLPDAATIAGNPRCLAVWGNGSGVGPWDCANLLPIICEISIAHRPRSELQPLEDTSSLIAPN